MFIVNYNLSGQLKVPCVNSVKQFNKCLVTRKYTMNK